MSESGNHQLSGRRHCIVALVVLLAVLPLMVVAMLGLKFANDDVQPWFPEGTAEREVYSEFIEAFGADDFALIALDGEDENNPEALSRLGAALAESSELVDSADMRPGDEGGRASLLVRSSATGAGDRAGVYAVILEVAEEELDDDQRSRMRITGPVFMGAAAEVETEKTLRRVAPLTALLSVIAALVLMRNLPLALIAFVTSSLAAMGSIALIHFTKGSVSNMLNIVPSIAQLLAMSNAVHLIHYYRDSSDAEIRAGSAWRLALRKGLRPTVAASGTTMIGLGSLWVSPIPVVREFAIYGALGVLGSMIAVLVFVPAALFLLRPVPGRGEWMRDRITDPLCSFTGRRAWSISALLGCLAILMAAGLPKLGPEVRMETLFSKQAKFSQDLAWFRDEFGPLQPCELLFRFPVGTTVDQSMEFFAELERKFAGSEADDLAVFSPARFAAAPRGILIKAMEANGRVASSNGDGSLWWRATVRHQPDPDPTDSAALREIRSLVESAVADSPAGAAPTWELTGGNQLFASAQAGLLGSLLKSFFLAVLLIAPLTMVFLKSVRLGAVAMLGNIFPLLVFFGALGWLGVRIDIATMMIASVAFGVAVDDTIHFLSWFRVHRDQPVAGRVRSAFSHSAAAIIQTTLIISLGMLAFAFSEFIPSRRFALFTSIVLGLAVVGDLVLLPSLVQGPLRRWLDKSLPRTGPI